MTEPQPETPKLPPSSSEQKTEIPQSTSSSIPQGQRTAANPNPEIQAILRRIQTQVTFSGPLPPPEVLERYNSIVPGAAERILKMAETQSLHRQELEKIAVKSGSRDSICGIVAGVIVCTGVLALAALAILKGFGRTGAAIAACDLAALAGVFVYGTQVNKNRREERQEANKPENPRQ